MAPRLRHCLFAAALTLAALLPAPSARAQGADAKAKKLAQAAMDEDYLATNMDAALSKLKQALSVCGQKCSPSVMATIHGNMGTVFAAGLARHSEAVDAFKKMLAADADAKPNASYLTGDVQKAFDEARLASNAGTPKPSGKPSVGKLDEDPWTEQATFHPVPVYVEVPEDLEIIQVSVRFRAPGSKDWKETKLKKLGEGWGGYIPCTSTQTKGRLSYFVTAFDTNLDRVASAGSAGKPRNVELKDSISGRQPALPDAVPPSPCPRPVERLSCETNDDCPGHQVCQALSCVDGPRESGKEEDTGRKMNWLSIAFSPDLLFVNSESDACSPAAQESGKLSCFFAGDTQYTGTPIKSGNSNSIQGGVGTGSMRVVAGYDRVLGTRMTAGVRLGFAFLGLPERADDKKFLPLHAEARFAYYLSSDPFMSTGVRPYLVVAGGVADSVARVSTTVAEDTGAGTRDFKLDVYQRGGPGFGGLGAGIQYAVMPEAAMVVEVIGRAALPEFAPVIAPSLGFAYGL